MYTKKFCQVEAVIDINDPNIWWWSIPGFRGYEISNNGYVRSMKHFNKYPYGILITPKKSRDGKILHPEDPTYELSDNNNERKCITYSQMVHLVKTNINQMPGYPRRTIVTNRSSRTQRIFVKNSLKYSPIDNNKVYPWSKLIVDEPEIKEQQKLEIPIKSIEGDVYYGRTDIRKG